MHDQPDEVESKKQQGKIDRYFHSQVSSDNLLPVLRAGFPYPFHFSWGLFSGQPHDLHELRRHFSRDLILNAALAIRIRLEKYQDLLLSDPRRFQPIEEFSVPDLTAQFFDSAHELLAVGANPRPKPSPFATEITTRHFDAVPSSTACPVERKLLLRKNFLDQALQSARQHFIPSHDPAMP